MILLRDLEQSTTGQFQGLIKFEMTCILRDLILPALFIIATLTRKHGMGHMTSSVDAFQLDFPHHIYLS